MYSTGMAMLVCPAASSTFVKPPPKFVPVTVKLVVLLAVTPVNAKVTLPDWVVPFALKTPSITADAHVKPIGVAGGGANVCTPTVQTPNPSVEVTLTGTMPPEPEPLNVIGIATNVCPAVIVAVTVPEKPPPEAVKVVVVGRVLMMATLSVPVCPPMPFAMKLPV